MKIQFLKDTSKAVLTDLPPDTFIVYKKGYSFPETVPNTEYLEFDVFKSKYFSLHANKLIFFGINKMITPQNRCDMVFDFMQSMTRNIEKMSIDTSPFLGEPWRLWYHFDMTNQNNFNVPHGFAMETEWKHWFFRDMDNCRLSAQELPLFKPRILSDLPELTTSISFNPVTPSTQYAEAKERSLQKGSPKLIINDLLKWANREYGLDASFESYLSNKSLVFPDIGITHPKTKRSKKSCLRHGPANRTMKKNKERKKQ